MISYCIAVYRTVYARMLVDELIRKTSAPYEVLLWLNADDAEFERDLSGTRARGLPVRVVGKSPENIGMAAYRHLFEAARYPLIAQIDDDILCVSRGIAELAMAVFERFGAVRQLVADVWQDEFTTGARPPLGGYRCVSARAGLYDGPVDGWFSIYHRDVRPQLLGLDYHSYSPIGVAMRQELRRRRMLGLLFTRAKVFHAIGPEYASLFGMLDFEIAKYRRLGRADIAEWYERAVPTLPERAVLQQRFEDLSRSLDVYASPPSGPLPRRRASSRRTRTT